MHAQIQFIAQLAEIDEQMDEFHQELGDLPGEVKDAEKKLRQKNSLVEETQSLLEELLDFRAKSGVMLEDLKTKEAKYAQQQFQVRNNREFDAITNEIENIRKERESINEKLRTSTVKEDNLRLILSQQQKDYDEVKSILDDKENQLKELSGSHSDEIRDLIHRRNELVTTIQPSIMEEYERIRTFHTDAAVKVRRNCCSGCFSAVPPQKLVEMRTKLDQIFTCEHCGRILITEGM